MEKKYISASIYNVFSTGFKSSKLNGIDYRKYLKEPTMKTKTLVGFLVYGVAVGLLSVWWWNYSGESLFLPNIPGVLLGDIVYDISIEHLGNPGSPQAHYTIPWILRIPQVYVPVSVLFWGMIGFAIHMARARLDANR